MRRRDLLRYTGVLTASAALGAAPKPNLLLVTVSGWRALDMNPGLKLPAIDRFAHQSLVFDRHYTACPESQPSRKALMTGRFPNSSGTSAGLADVLKEKNPAFLSVEIDFPPLANRTMPAADIELRPNVPDDAQTASRNEIGAYYAGCESAAAKAAKFLDEACATENTIVVFTSECGAMLGSHGLHGSGQPFEESLRVPLMIRYPGGPTGRSDLLISSVDVMPTLLHLCGVDAPEGVQGRSFDAIFHGDQSQRPTSVYAFGKLGTPGEWRAVVRGLDKIVFDRDLNVTHLFNLGQDPYEQENLVHDRSQELKRDELSAILKDWMRRASDRMDPSGLKKRK